jgi:GNAT superfamily N-acetyltransferase
VIRPSWPEDTPEIQRLALAQYLRTPWPLEMQFPPAMAFLINWHNGHASACCGYRWDGDDIRVLHVWAEDGFRGRRAAVELMKHVERAADSEGLALVFNARVRNVGLRSAVERHGCEPSPGEDDQAVEYRREGRAAWVAR